MDANRAGGWLPAAKWAVRLSWGAGWLLAQRAAGRSLMFGSTESTVREYEQSLPYGLGGAALMLLAALARFSYRSRPQAAWFALLPVVSLLLFAQAARGEPFFWQLLCLLAAVGVLTQSVISDRALKRRAMLP